MLTRLKDNYSPPVLADPARTRVARVAYVIALAILGVVIGIELLWPIVVPSLAYRMWLNVPLIVIVILLIPLLRRGRLKLVAIVMLLATWATLTWNAETAGGILSPPFHLYFVVILIAGLLLGWRATALTILLVLATGFGMYFAELNHWIPPLLTEGLLIRTWIVFDAAVVLVTVLCILAIRELNRALAAAQQELTERERADAALQRANAELAEAYDTTIEGWARMMELRADGTQDHSLRVADLTTRLAMQMGIPEAELVHLRRGALLHDIGKIAIPDTILHKPGPLTEQEWAIMRRHPEYAYQVLSTISYLHPARDIPYYHHEKWDGTGYPLGLKGAEIPLGARLFAVVDVWDALSSDRSYRKKWSAAQVLEYLYAHRGTHFDTQAVDAFVNLISAEQADTANELPAS